MRVAANEKDRWAMVGLAATGKSVSEISELLGIVDETIHDCLANTDMLKLITIQASYSGLKGKKATIFFNGQEVALSCSNMHIHFDINGAKSQVTYCSGMNLADAVLDAVSRVLAAKSIDASALSLEARPPVRMLPNGVIETIK